MTSPFYVCRVSILGARLLRHPNELAAAYGSALVAVASVTTGRVIHLAVSLVSSPLVSSPLAFSPLASSPRCMFLPLTSSPQCPSSSSAAPPRRSLLPPATPTVAYVVYAGGPAAAYIVFAGASSSVHCCRWRSRHGVHRLYLQPRRVVCCFHAGRRGVCGYFLFSPAAGPARPPSCGWRYASRSSPKHSFSSSSAGLLR